MTEYDYSPDAIERHMAKQAQIAGWVDDTLQHEPANPFIPIPGEHAPSEAYYHPPPHPNQLYSQQQYQYQQPYPAYYTTPQGVISPTYSGSSKRHHHHHSKHHHSSGSKSLRPSPHTSYAALPSMPMGLTYAPTPQRSVSTPPSMVMMNSGNVYPTTTPQQAYVGYQTMQPTYPSVSQGYYQQMQIQPPMALPQTNSYSTSQSHSYSSQPSSSRKHRSRSHSRSTSYSLPRSQPMYGVQSPPLSNGGGPQIFQSPPNQSACVPINGGGYVIIPPGQKAVIAPMDTYTTYPYASSDHYYPRGYDSDSGSEHGGSFFGHISLKKIGTSFLGGGHKKSKRRERRDSY